MTVRVGDCLKILGTLEAGSAQTCVTSPPYFGLRDYGVEGQHGLERIPDCLGWARGAAPCDECFVCRMRKVFAAVHRVLRDDGTLWLNIGDSYANDGKWGGSTGGKHASALHGATSIGRGKVTTGLKPKDLIGIPWRVAFALQADGWYLRQDIIWHKPNPMPESVRDRCTKAHEYLFLLAKSERYYFDAEAIKELAVSGNEAQWAGDQPGLHSGESHAGTGKSTRRFAKGVAGWGTGRNNAIDHNVVGRATHAQLVKEQQLEVAIEGPLTRNKRSVWRVPTIPFKDAHFATFPEALIEPCVLASTKPGDVVLDPYGGSGTTGVVAQRFGRDFILCELSPHYAAMAETRARGAPMGLALTVAEA